jgi:hypothetical protein
LILKIVVQLAGLKTLVGHAFDYDLKEKNEQFLKDMYAGVEKHWLERPSSMASTSTK